MTTSDQEHFQKKLDELEAARVQRESQYALVQGRLEDQIKGLREALDNEIESRRVDHAQHGRVMSQMETRMRTLERELANMREELEFAVKGKLREVLPTAAIGETVEAVHRAGSAMVDNRDGTEAEEDGEAGSDQEQSECDNQVRPSNPSFEAWSE